MKLFELVNATELRNVEVFADNLWSKLGVEVKFTRHFLERLNDARNGKDISAAELVRLFKKEYQAYGREIMGLDDNAEAVLVDLVTKLNLPFVIKQHGDQKELVAKTIMRKQDFKSADPAYEVN